MNQPNPETTQKAHQGEQPRQHKQMESAEAKCKLQQEKWRAEAEAK